MKILYLDQDLNNLLDIAYNPGMAKEVEITIIHSMLLTLLA